MKTRLLTLWLLLATVCLVPANLQATVSTTAPRNDYIGNGATATYSYTFRIFADTDLRVTKRDTSGVETALVLTTDYTVTGVNKAAGGTITLVAGNLPTDYALTIRFDRTPRQSTDLRNQGSFFPETHEDKFDELTRYSQQLEDVTDRSIHLPETEAGTAAATTLPAASSRADKFLAWDSSGNVIAAAGTSGTLGPVSSYINTLLDDANAAAARATLGVNSATTSAEGLVELATSAEAITGTDTVRAVTPAALAAVIPTGVIWEYGGSSAPTGYLLMNQDVSRTTYAALFAVVGTTYGAGDGSTTFGLHKEGRVSIGAGTGTKVASGVNADVDTTNDTLTVASNNTKWITGQAVTFTLASGTITGLTTATTYYVIRNNSTTIKLASTLANAQNGTAIDLTAKSSPVWTITLTYTARTLGEYGGEETHAMSSTELLAHTHGMDLAVTDGGVNNNVNRVQAGAVSDTTTISAGGNAAMNIMPPFVTSNFIIKY